MNLKLAQTLTALLMLFSGLACGVSKDIHHRTGGVPLPDFENPKNRLEEEGTKTLKSSELEITPAGQPWKSNTFLVPSGGEAFLKWRKRFVAPIQFNGWIVLDHVTHAYGGCSGPQSAAPLFTLEDDHRGSQVLTPGQKVEVSLEKLYHVRVDFDNEAGCGSLEIKFGVLYGTHE